MKGSVAAFTLTEMLVVIAILGALTGLLLPGLARARQKAKATVCRSNLGQIGRALSAYTSESGKYPGTRSTPNRVPPRSQQDWAQVWDHRLLPYAAGTRPIFGCPADQPPYAQLAHSLTNYSYGYNAYGSGRLPPELNLGLGHAEIPENRDSRLLEISEAQIKAPSDMIAVGDLTDHPQVFTTTITPTSRAPYPGAPAARHSAGANVVFCDGHVEFGKQSSWVRQTAAARQRWNNDHQPHPESWE